MPVYELVQVTVNLLKIKKFFEIRPAIFFRKNIEWVKMFRKDWLKGK